MIWEHVWSEPRGAETTNEKSKDVHVGGDRTEAVKIWFLDFVFELLFQS